jgi:hypothetical protein
MKTKTPVIAGILLLIIVIVAACSTASPTSVPVTEGAKASVGPTWTPLRTPLPPGEDANGTAEHTPTPSPSSAPSPEIPPTPPLETELPALLVRTSLPFAEGGLLSWTPQPYAGEDYALPLDLDQVANPQVLAGLTDEQQHFLAQNGFVVIHSQEAQFSAIRKGVLAQGQPYFLTTDAAFHSLHLTFDELLKALEREQLYPQMVAVIQAMLDDVVSSLSATEGTSIEEDTLVAGAYLSVALKLFDPEAEIDPRLESVVSVQLEQIMAAGGRGCSVILRSFEDDYGAYKPVGHYAGDQELERYFQGMTWLGRVHFSLVAESTSDNCPQSSAVSRTPLILTLALRRAQVGDRSAADVWARIHEVLTYMIGPSDDSGPVEYAALMDQVYGDNLTLADLANDALWAEFQDRRAELPTPQINSTFVDWVTQDMPMEVGWRFMGQRFTLDGFIFQNLIFDKISPAQDGELRLLPTGIDVMAVLGSQTALDQLVNQDEARFPDYFDQLTKLQEGIRAQSEREWLLRFYDSWLFAFLPVLEAKNASYPSYMRTGAWAQKEMNTALGSWAELKHDTVLYAKMPEAGGGGGPPTSPPPPGYVEADPNAFYRMAYVAQTLVDGLRNRNMAGGSAWPDSRHLGALMWRMERLAVDFRALGDIAVKELAGLPLDESDYEVLLRGGLSPFEDSTGRVTDQELDPPPIVAAVAGSGSLGDEVLEVATGYIDRIYVVVRMGDELHIAQGGTYSYYEFVQPRSARLTDQEWRERLTGPNAPPLPAWSSSLLLPGGQPADWLAFRVGDVYWVNEAGDGVNLRNMPSLAGTVLTQLNGGPSLAPQTYFEIIEGPVVADGYRWWQVSVFFLEQTGWLVEDQAWYERSY